MKFLLPALLLLIGGLVMEPATVASWLTAGSAAPNQGLVVHGVALFRWLLFIDAAVLVLAGLCLQRCFAPVVNRAQEPLWRPSPVATGPDMRANSAVAVIALLLVLAFMLRIIGLNSDLWIDEVLTVVNYVRQSSGAILTDFTDDNQHMLFSLLSHFSISLFGESAWAVRLPSLLFGVGSIWIVFRLARLVYGQYVAIWSAALLTVSYHHIWFSQNARGYMLLLFFTLLATWLFLRGLQYRRWRDWIAYALAVAAAAWSHLSGVFVAIAHGLVLLPLLLRHRDSPGVLLQPMTGLLLSGWITLHCYALVLPQLLDFFGRPGGGSGSSPVEWRSPLWLVNELLRGFGFNADLGWTGVVVLAGTGIACAWWYLRRDWVFVLSALLPGVLLGLLMLLLGRNLWPRMFFNEAGFIVILLVVGALTIGGLAARYLPPGRPATFAYVLPAAALLASFLLMLPSLYKYPKQDFTGARDFVLSRVGATDRVAGLHMAGHVYNRYYERKWPEINELTDLQAAREHPGRLWVLYTLPGYLESAMPETARVLNEEFDLIQTFPGTLGDGAIIVRRSRLAGDKEP